MGLDIRRTGTSQAHSGGVDLVGVPGWAIEVKRAQTLAQRPWWQQTLRQAEILQAKPALIYRIDGAGYGQPEERKWQVVVRLRDVGCVEAQDEPCTMALAAWMTVVRAEL